MAKINKKILYRNAKGQFVSKKVVEGVQKYYDKVKIESYKPESIIQEIKSLDLKKLNKINFKKISCCWKPFTNTEILYSTAVKF